MFIIMQIKVFLIYFLAGIAGPQCLAKVGATGSEMFRTCGAVDLVMNDCQDSDCVSVGYLDVKVSGKKSSVLVRLKRDQNKVSSFDWHYLSIDQKILNGVIVYVTPLHSPLQFLPLYREYEKSLMER